MTRGQNLTVGVDDDAGPLSMDLAPRVPYYAVLQTVRESVNTHREAKNYVKCRQQYKTNTMSKFEAGLR